MILDDLAMPAMLAQYRVATVIEPCDLAPVAVDLAQRSRRCSGDTDPSVQLIDFKGRVMSPTAMADDFVSW